MATEAAEQPVLTAKQSGQNPRSAAVEAASVTVVKDNAHEEPTDVMSAVLERLNLERAYDRVLRNKGAPGVDGMAVTDLGDYLKAYRPIFLSDIPKFEDTRVFEFLVRNGLGVSFETFEKPIDFVRKNLFGEWLVWLLVLGHASAGMYHHFVKKDRALLKMT